MAAFKPTPVDRPAIADAARAEVDDAVALVDDAEQRLNILGPIASRNDALFHALRAARDEAGLSLSLYDGVRAVNRGMGLSRQRFYDMRVAALGLTASQRESKWLLTATKDEVAAKAKKAKVVRLTIAKAKTALESVVVPALHAEEMSVYAKQLRDLEIVRLAEQGWTRGQIAEIIGADLTRISHIRRASRDREAVMTG